MTFSHRIIKDLDSLAANELRILQDSWNRLAQLTQNPLVTFDWCYACYSTVHAKDDVLTVVVSDDQEIVAIAPMVCRRLAGRMRIEVVGTTALYEPAGLLASSKNAMLYLVNTLIAMRLPICLLRMQDQDPVHDVIRELGRSRSIAVWRPSASTATVDLDCTWDHLLQQLSTNRRYDLQRKLKRAEVLGPVALREHAPDESEVDHYFDIALDVEHDSWKGEAGSSLRANLRLQNFFRQFLQLSCKERKARFYFLEVGKTIAAMQITVETDNSCLVLKQGYRASQSRLSPGILLSHMAIKSCLERGLSSYEFLGAEEQWQSSWPIRRTHYRTIVVIPYSIAGVMESIAAISSRFRAQFA